MSKKQAIKAISLLWMGSLLGAFFAFSSQVLLARRLGPDNFGTFSAALMTVTSLAPLAGFGVSQFWLKAFGQEGWQATRWLPSSFRFVVISTTLIIISLLAWSLLGPHDEGMRIILLPLTIYVLGQVVGEMVSSKLQLEERFILLSLWQLMPNFLRLLTIVILLFISREGTRTVDIACGYAIVAMFITSIGIKHIIQMYKCKIALKGHVNIETSNNKTDKPNLSILFNQSWPFGIAGVFYLIYFQSDIILVKYISGSEEAGIYNVAFSIMAGTYLLPAVIFQKFLLPKIHRWANHDRRKFFKVYRQGNFAMLLLGLIVMIVIWLAAPWVIPIIFGTKYVTAIPLLNILAVCAPVIFVATSVGASLVTQEHMKKKVKFMGVIALFNTLLNIILIPKYGAIGAASSTLSSNILLLTVYYFFAEKVIFKKI